MDWLAVFLIGLVSGISIASVFLTWRSLNRKVEQHISDSKKDEIKLELSPVPGSADVYQPPEPAKGDELLARLEAPAVVFGEADSGLLEALEGGSGSPSAQEPPRAQTHSRSQKGRCRFCGGDYGNVWAHQRTCKMRPKGKIPQKKRHRRTKAEMMAAEGMSNG